MTSPRRQLDPPDERSLVSARLLLDLVNNTLDPGYAAAARRHGGTTRRSRWDVPLAAAGALLVGFVLVVAYVNTHRGAPEAQKVHDRLVERVRAAQKNADGLADQLDEVGNTLAAAQAKALPQSGQLAVGLQRARLAAGLVAVSGPGLTVTLKEPPAPTASANGNGVRTVPMTGTSILTDRDVRSVVNELWLDGAEAVSVNDVRLTPTTAIRTAGEAVLVDFQPITSPYRIRAIGNSDTLSTAFAQSAVASRYNTIAGTDGIGFSFTDSQHLDLPAGSGNSLRFAEPVLSATKEGPK